MAAKPTMKPAACEYVTPFRVSDQVSPGVGSPVRWTTNGCETVDAASGQCAVRKLLVQVSFAVQIS